jgi:glycerate kinase
LKSGCKDFIIGIGGSATNDGGIGMASALGVRFFDDKKNPIDPTGAGLGRLHNFDESGIDPRVRAASFTVVCDVDNPLYGPTGAAYVFAPQKGADPAMVQTLDANLRHYAELLKRRLGIDAQAIPGAGAAGGLGVAFVAFACAVMKPGIQTILDAANFDSLIRDADCVITGEGRMDPQTLMGKVPVGVARRAGTAGIPVLAIVGQTEGDISGVYAEGITAVYETRKKQAPFEVLKRTCRADLYDAAVNAVRIFNNREE